jgi:hypothetical protein
MNRSEPVLPRAQTPAVPRSPEDRAALLAWLATHETEAPGRLPVAIVSDALTANAAGSLTGEALLEAWRDYRLAVREERDAKDRPLTWLDRGVSSIEMARRSTQAALNLLVHGGAA